MNWNLQVHYGSPICWIAYLGAWRKIPAPCAKFPSPAMSEVPNSINLVGGFGLGGWGDSGYVFPPMCEDEPEMISILSKTCVDEQILNSQFSSPSFSNYSPQDTEP